MAQINLDYLDFERPITELQQKIDELRNVADDSEVNLTEEIKRLETKRTHLIEQVFSKLTTWQVVQLARHPLRPNLRDYIDGVMTDFVELHGDRRYADDQAIVAGTARLQGRPVMVIGHQKGRDTKEKVARNFGMPRPEGYRKALRIAKLAERFDLPILTFIDTPGAYPGIGAEQRNQSEAIARNLYEFARLRVPIISTIIGEGGSGGALAIGVGDSLCMLEYSIYSVISPEGCATILWKSADYAQQAAGAMKVSARDLDELKLVDEVINEPAGGAHRDTTAHVAHVGERLSNQLDALCSVDRSELLAARDTRWRSFGAFKSGA